MIYTPMTKKAIKLIFEKHKNQVDKAGMPYVLHPLHVAEKMNDEDSTIVALLHDIVEDTDVTFEDLINMGFNDNVIAALRLLTHDENVEYLDYIKGISTNPIATKVKIADLEHNSDLSRLNEITETDLKRVEKYKYCIDFLKKTEKLYEVNSFENQKDYRRENMQLEKNVITSSLIGFAVGDAVGVPAEFKNREVLRNNPVTDMVGYGTHSQPEGTWSDDSSMTIATMDSINDCGKIDYEDIMKRFYEWVSEAKYTATGVFFDIGIATRTALSNYRMGVPPTQCGGTRINDNGNGSLMRILPIVLYSYSKGLSFSEEVELIDNMSSLTHGHEISRLGCKIYSDYIKGLLDGKNKQQALENLEYIDYSADYSQESLKYYNRILTGKIGSVKENEIKSTGFVVDTLEATIWCILNSSSYKESVLKAVNLGDDTDTIGAITGSISGIIYGLDDIPKEWVDKLKRKDYLISLCDKFSKTLDMQKTKS